MTFEVYVGPMCAGKTTRLCNTASELVKTGARVEVWSPSVDTRHSGGIVTHDGVALESGGAKVIPMDSDYGNGLNEDTTDLLVDEVQFFHPRIVEALLSFVGAGVHVRVYGLYHDYLSRVFPYPGDPTVSTMADLYKAVLQVDGAKWEFLHGTCRWCPRPSHWTRRISEAKDLVQIGGAESYAPTCSRHSDTSGLVIDAISKWWDAGNRLASRKRGAEIDFSNAELSLFDVGVFPEAPPELREYLECRRKASCYKCELMAISGGKRGHLECQARHDNFEAAKGRLQAWCARSKKDIRESLRRQTSGGYVGEF